MTTDGVTASGSEATALSDAKRALLQRWRQGNVDVRRQHIAATPYVAPAPTSLQQEIVARRHADSPGSPAFTIAHAARVGAAIDPQLVSEAFAALAERHEILRTTFEVGVDQVAQRVGDQANFDFEAIDLTSHAPGASHAPGTSLDLATDLCRELAVRPMNIASGPLGRLAVLRVDRELSVLLIAVDHLIADGYSLGIALQEASELYEALRDGRRASLADLDVQYRDYAAWQRAWLAGEASRSQVDYWRRQLHGLSPAQLARDSPDELGDGRAASSWFQFTPELSKRVRDVARAEGVTPFHVLFGAFSLLHRLLTDQTQLGIGTAFHNRLYPEVEPLIGYFANTVVLRVDLTGRPDGREFLQRLKETTAAAWTRQEIVLGQYVAEAEPGRDLRADPLYRTFFVLQPPLQARTFAGGELASVGVETGVASFDLAMYMWDEPVYRGKLEWASDLLSTSTGEWLRGAYLRLLDALLDDCAVPIDKLIDRLIADISPS